MRIMLRHGNFIHKTSTQFLNRPPRRHIIRITRNDHLVVNGTHKRRNRPARLECITVPAMFLANFKTNVSRTDSNMIRITHSKINVTDIRPIKKKDPKMISWNKIP